jgi:flagellar basal body-associated protein FliL
MLDPRRASRELEDLKSTLDTVRTETSALRASVDDLAAKLETSGVLTAILIFVLIASTALSSWFVWSQARTRQNYAEIRASLKTLQNLTTNLQTQVGEVTSPLSSLRAELASAIQTLEGRMPVLHHGLSADLTANALEQIRQLVRDEIRHAEKTPVVSGVPDLETPVPAHRKEAPDISSSSLQVVASTASPPAGVAGDASLSATPAPAFSTSTPLQSPSVPPISPQIQAALSVLDELRGLASEQWCSQADSLRGELARVKSLTVNHRQRLAKLITALYKEAIRAAPEISPFHVELLSKMNTAGLEVIVPTPGAARPASGFICESLADARRESYGNVAEAKLRQLREERVAVGPDTVLFTVEPQVFLRDSSMRGSEVPYIPGRVVVPG